MDTFIKLLLFTGDYLMVNINQVIFAQIGIETYLNHKNICNISETNPSIEGDKPKKIETHEIMETPKNLNEITTKQFLQRNYL